MKDLLDNCIYIKPLHKKDRYFVNIKDIMKIYRDKTWCIKVRFNEDGKIRVRSFAISNREYSELLKYLSKIYDSLPVPPRPITNAIMEMEV